MDKKEIKKVNLRLGNLNFRRTQDDNYEIVKWITREDKQERNIALSSHRSEYTPQILYIWSGVVDDRSI